MKHAEDLTEKELERIRFVTGDAFVTNELFHEFGSIEERRPLVLKYMSAFVDFAYESGSIYMTDDGCGFIGLQYSKDNAVLPQLKMLVRLFTGLPFGKLKKMLGHVGQIADTDKQFKKVPHIDVLMVAVNKDSQGKGYARQLIDFAKKMSEEKKLPLLIGTDMKDYADMYCHYGFRLACSKTADNGVTRYVLTWQPSDKAK